jgi:hypothetical protein
MSDPFDLPELRELRRQEAHDAADNDKIEELLWREHDAELNELSEGWVDSRGRPLEGFEPVDVPTYRGDPEHASMMRERGRIERAASTRRR